MPLRGVREFDSCESKMNCCAAERFLAPLVILKKAADSY